MAHDQLRIGSVCSGYRGLDMGVEAVFDGTTAWVSDIDPGANQILAHHWPDVPNLGDLTTTDWSAVEPVDIVCGGYPCQPVSLAGQLKGTADARWIWPHIARALGVLRPRYAVFENVGNHLRLGFDTVLADLAALRFDAEWICVRASDAVLAPHNRRRLILLATAQDADRESRHQRRLAAPGQAEAGRARADAGGRGGAPAAGTGRPGLEVRGVEPHRNERQAAERGGDEPAADTARVGRSEGRPEPARLEGRSGTPRSSAPDWGRFGPAIRRWEHATGRRAPWATDDRNRLSPAFVEWLMGLPAGHVTDVPGLSRNQQLHALGNGVVPQQAEAALRVLLARSEATAAAA
ncbi:DNA cytosine methyltransferase [Streptomyces sp. NPDC046631]|uniref:DNA cytosine methyltransferase n=1 Tax=unclassified Streptomyces TaxID=2593676 RepID=UPI0033FD8A42